MLIRFGPLSTSMIIRWQGAKHTIHSFINSYNLINTRALAHTHTCLRPLCMFVGVNVTRASILKFRFCKYAREKIEKFIFIHICFWPIHPSIRSFVRLLVRWFVTVESIATQTFGETTQYEIDRWKNNSNVKLSRAQRERDPPKAVEKWENKHDK